MYYGGSGLIVQRILAHDDDVKFICSVGLQISSLSISCMCLYYFLRGLCFSGYRIIPFDEYYTVSQIQSRAKILVLQVNLNFFFLILLYQALEYIKAF